MKFEIRSIHNGVLLKCEDDDLEMCFTESYREEDNIECFADFLRLIEETFGPMNSRYSEKRIYIHIKPGDKSQAADMIYAKKLQFVKRKLLEYGLEKDKNNGIIAEEFAENILSEIDDL